jgi:hypothetical protein
MVIIQVKLQSFQRHNLKVVLVAVLALMVIYHILVRDYLLQERVILPQ